ncbi:hypothetical protein LSH36_257g03078 [Paralvinella palmiformis]|uniref:Uncharacterized protein n=1 Tax=Paralvinella palmiformis TaxID=53620 RepID=A0AAD9JL76_9ANNE|nr:hypothetical protein LSH36_257g03078 [Paralvinella palmiformis]
MTGMFLALTFLVLFLVYDWWKRRERVDEIHRKAVFITGCDSGFGKALAKLLYVKGVPVYAACLTESGAKSLRNETGDALWGVVNNAGIAGQPGPVELLTKEDFKQVMDVNLYGMIDVAIAFLPMLKKSRGRIINMSSMAANVAFPNQTTYCVSKHAVTGFSDSLRVEKSVWGISVSTIQPSFYHTGVLSIALYGDKLKQKWRSSSPALRDEYGDDYDDRSVKLAENMFTTHAAVDIKPVLDAMEHALFSVCPRSVYYPGISAKIIKRCSDTTYFTDVKRCDSGFGYALAKSLYAKGVPVYAACLNESGAMKLRKEASDSLKTVIVDVTNTESVQNAAAFVQNNLPNNVGKYPVKGVTLTRNMYNTMADSDIKPVTEAIEHALFSACPRAVYYPGLKAKLMKISPNFILDKILLHYTELPKCVRNN